MGFQGVQSLLSDPRHHRKAHSAGPQGIWVPPPEAVTSASPPAWAVSGRGSAGHTQGQGAGQ